MTQIQIKKKQLLTRPEQFQGVPTFIAEILARRGVQSEQELELKLKNLLAPNLKGIDVAVELIDQAIDQQRQIVIIGDYDADGATSTALMILVLKEMGARVEYLVPDRFKYGYGLTPAIADLAKQTYQPDLLITVDNGISSHAGVETAHAFYVLAKLASYRNQQAKSTCKVTQYLDLVALGTYADVATLDYNNRILIDTGLKRIQQYQCRAGILALLEIAKRDAATLRAQDLGFVIGPRINAAGRMESMRIGIECLLAPDLETAYPIAQQLNQLNIERRQVETEMKQQAMSALQHIHLETEQLPAALVMFDQQWHQGVIGIVAGRLKEQFHRPSLVFAPDDDGIHIKGSARSIEGIHIRDMIEQVAEQYPHLVSHFGGHAAAAGLTLRKEHFDKFKSVFIQAIAQMDEDLFQPILWTDGELVAADLNLNTLDWIDQLGPWGQKFPLPQFEGRFQIIDYRWLKDQHLKLKLASGNHSIDAIAFNAIDRFEFNPMLAYVDLVYTLERNVFNGNTSLQLQITHLKQ